MRILSDLAKTLRWLLTSPLDELGRVQRFTRHAVDLARHCARTLAQDRAPQMVAALTYRTIFSLVPTVVLAMLMFKAFVQLESAEAKVHEYVYDLLNVRALEQVAGLQQSDPLRDEIDTLITEITEKAYQLNFQNVGGLGLLLLIWGAMGLMVTVEQCFNRIYDAPSGRPWYQRVMLYWAVLTLGPFLLAVSFYLADAAAKQASSMAVIGPLLAFAGHFTGLGFRWLLFLLLYRLMPNTNVNLRPALVGSLVATLLWSLGQWGFALYVSHAVSYSALYGSLGLIPLFLIWLYLSWLIVLFGLALSYTLQTLRGWQVKQGESRREANLRADPRWLIPMIAQIGQAFLRGVTTDRQTLADALGLPRHAINALAVQLEEAGLIYQVQGGKRQPSGYALARPPEKISIGQLIELGGCLRGQPIASLAPAFALLDDLNTAQQQAVTHRTLASLLADLNGTR